MRASHRPAVPVSVEARNKIRGHVPCWIGDWWLPEPQHPEPPASDLKGLAAYDQARGNYPEIPNSSRRAQEAGARALAMREARERAGASCP